MKAIAKRRPRVTRLYFSAKISDYQFRKILWHFTLDHSALETAKHTTLSVNSISAVYGKLRKFFFDYGLFNDPYRGRDPREGYDREGYEVAEHMLLTFHLERVSDKHGRLDSAMDAPDYHLSESDWRFGFLDMRNERGPELVYRMMYENLLEFIRRFGPVGAKTPVTPQQRLQGLRLAVAQLERRDIWLERNAVRYRDAERRTELRKLREI